MPRLWPGGWWRAREIVEQQIISAMAVLELGGRGDQNGPGHVEPGLAVGIEAELARTIGIGHARVGDRSGVGGGDERPAQVLRARLPPDSPVSGEVVSLGRA